MGLREHRDLLGEIRALIHEETAFLRSWPGKVVDDQDPSSRGRVKVTVPELGFLGDDQAMWCSPRQGYGIQPPAPGEWVEVYFMGGDRARPVYSVGAGEIAGNTPKAYTDPKIRVLWQNAATGDSIVYHEDTKEFDMNLSGEYSLKIGSGAEAFTLGNTLSTFLQSLSTWLSTHTHTSMPPGSPSGPPLSPVTILPNITSEKISGE